MADAVAKPKAAPKKLTKPTTEKEGNPAPVKAPSKLAGPPGAGKSLPVGEDRFIKADAGVALLAFAFDAIEGPVNRLTLYREAEKHLEGLFPLLDTLKKSPDDTAAFSAVTSKAKLFREKLEKLGEELSVVQEAKYWVTKDPKKRDAAQAIKFAMDMISFASSLKGFA